MIEEKPLGWRVGPSDSRDRPLTATLEKKMAEPKVKEYGSKHYFAPSTLNQWVGSCVGHGAIQVFNASPKVHRFTDQDAMRVYESAQYLDPWSDTPPEEGTSVRAGALAMREFGYWKAFAMAYNYQDKAISIVEVARFILNAGPLMFGISWREGYDNPTREDNYFLKAEGQDRGGHNIKVDAVRYRGNPDTDWFRVHNSWGGSWGYSAYGHGGFARIPWRLMEQIMEDEDTTVCSPVEA